MPGQIHIGPQNGSLLLAGGGELGEIYNKFVALAGGSSAPIVLVPTAAERDYSGLYAPEYGGVHAGWSAQSQITAYQGQRGRGL